MTVFEQANARLDNMVASARSRLAAHRAQGLDDDKYQVDLVGQFHAYAQLHGVNAGSVTHMALSLFRLAVAADLIEKLDAENARYAATLADLEALDGLNVRDSDDEKGR